MASMSKDYWDSMHSFKKARVLLKLRVAHYDKRATGMGIILQMANGMTEVVRPRDFYIRPPKEPLQ